MLFSFYQLLSKQVNLIYNHNSTFSKKVLKQKALTEKKMKWKKKKDNKSDVFKNAQLRSIKLKCKWVREKKIAYLL